MKNILMRLRRGMSCDEVMVLVQSYLDGETDVETARKVAKHLESCTACDRESDVYRNIKASLAARQRPVDPEIMASLRQFSANMIAEAAE